MAGGQVRILEIFGSCDALITRINTRIACHMTAALTKVGLDPCLVLVNHRKELCFKLNIGCKSFTTSPDDKILVWSKLKEIADDILKCI